MTAANVSPGTLHSSSFVIRTDVFCFLNEWKWIPETAKRQMPYGQSRFLVSLGSSSSSSLSVAAAAAAPTSTNEKDDVETGTSREKKERSTSNALVITAAVAKLSASHRKKNSRQQPHGEEEEGSTLRGSLLGATQPRERATTRMI